MVHIWYSEISELKEEKHVSFIQRPSKNMQSDVNADICQM